MDPILRLFLQTGQLLLGYQYTYSTEKMGLVGCIDSTAGGAGASELGFRTTLVTDRLFLL